MRSIDAQAPESSREKQLRLVDTYSAEIAARQAQLAQDRAIFEKRMCDLAELDPRDLTGLRHLYGAHIGQINLLLSEFEPA